MSIAGLLLRYKYYDDECGCDIVPDSDGGEYVKYEDIPQWISVDDRLPDPYAGKHDEPPIQYLCYGRRVNSDAPFYYAATYLGGYSGWTIPGIGGLTVTHWMPLPSAPDNT